MKMTGDNNPDSKRHSVANKRQRRPIYIRRRIEHRKQETRGVRQESFGNSKVFLGRTRMNYESGKRKEQRRMKSGIRALL
jgi:hypothetical protein